MSIKTVDVNELQTQWEKLLSLVKTGTEIILTEDGKSIARLVPDQFSSLPRVPGLHAGAIWTSDDFDQPLPDEFLTDCSGKS